MSPTPATTRGPRRRARGAEPRVAPWLLLAPFLVIFATFVAYPLALSVRLSLEQSFGPAHTRFVGLQNFAFLLDDPLFWKALKNTLVFAAGSVFIQLPLALGLALLLNSNLLRGRGLFRLIFFAPQLVGLVFAGILSSVIFQKREGLLNQALHWLTGAAFDLDYAWLEVHIMPALIIAALWMYVGFNMVYFLAALQAVDRSLAEAAELDGAGPIARFVHVTLPAIAPVAGFVTLLSIIGSLQLFELPFLMLGGMGGTAGGGGGPENRGLTLVTYLYQMGFEQSDLGYASAVGWLLALVLVFFAIAYRALALRGES